MKNSGWKRLCSLLLCLTMLASLLAGCGGRTAVTEPETPEPAQQTEAEPVQVAAGEHEDEPVPVAPQPIAREAIKAALDKAGASAETLTVTVRSQDLEKVLDELAQTDGVEDARPVADNGDTAVISVTPSPDADPDLEDLEGVAGRGQRRHSLRTSPAARKTIKKVKNGLSAHHIGERVCYNRQNAGCFVQNDAAEVRLHAKG